MSMPLSPTRLFTCTACGAVLPVGDEHLGKKCRCGRCGKVSLIDDDLPRRNRPESSAPDEFTTFVCRVCDTSLAAPVGDVGQQAKCPDCGALTEVPPPAKPQKPQIPKAMHGQQYGLWGVDDAPDPSEIAAAQPKFFPVYCRVCDTLMHALLQQVGKKLVCPDCGAKTEVKQPPSPKPKKSALVPDGEEYQLDAPVKPAPLPTVSTAPVAPTPPKDTRTQPDPIRTERRSRPKLPLLPTLQGLLPMLVKSPIWGWWMWLSMMLSLIGLSARLALTTQIVGIPQAILVLFSYAMSCVLGILCFSAASALWLRVLTESSEGNDRLHHPPSINFVDWLGDMCYFFTSAAMAVLPLALLGQALRFDGVAKSFEWVVAGGWLFTFPLVLLSCLENGSPLEPLSAKLVRSVVKRPLHWLLLVLQSVVVFGGCALVLRELPLTKLWTVPVVAALVAATGLFYFRLLGRFAWWLAESLATSD